MCVASHDGRTACEKILKEVGRGLPVCREKQPLRQTLFHICIKS